MREFFLDPRTRRTDCLNGYGIQWRSVTECYLDSTGTFRDAIGSSQCILDEVRMASPPGTYTTLAHHGRAPVRHLALCGQSTGDGG
jgi:hypothetical protein